MVAAGVVRVRGDAVRHDLAVLVLAAVEPQAVQRAQDGVLKEAHPARVVLAHHRVRVALQQQDEVDHGGVVRHEDARGLARARGRPDAVDAHDTRPGRHEGGGEQLDEAAGAGGGVRERGGGGVVERGGAGAGMGGLQWSCVTVRMQGAGAAAGPGSGSLLPSANRLPLRHTHKISQRDTLITLPRSLTAGNSSTTSSRPSTSASRRSGKSTQ